MFLSKHFVVKGHHCGSKQNYLITASSGFAKANNIATPTPIKKVRLASLS